MVNYYKILNVSADAAPGEIKSAYRRLARQMHPDIKGGDEETHRNFAQVIKAYEILSNPRKRAGHDRQLNHKNSNGDSDSVLKSENAHARRLRQIAIENRYNQIIDRMIADERQETLALQKIIFPTVALFFSTLFVGIFKPAIFSHSDIIGKLVIVTLFTVGLLHLLKRVKTGLDRYTNNFSDLHDSIFDDSEPEKKPYSKLTAILFLIFGTAISFGIGVFVGNYLEMFIQAMIPGYFSHTLKAEFIFYPPIVVLLVDGMHKLISSFE